MSSKEAMDIGSSGRRRGSAPKAGSVWESRMKIDEFKGGIKVFNENPAQNEESKTEIEIHNKQSPIPIPIPNPNPNSNGVSGKRKTWKSESCDGSPVKIAALRSELSKELGDGIRKSPVSIKKTSLRKAKSDCGDADVDGDGDEKKVVDDERERKSRSDCEEIKAIVVCNGGDESDKEIQVKKEIGVNDHIHSKQKRIVIEDKKKLVQTNQKTEPISSSSFVRKQPSLAPVNHARFNPNPSKSNTNSDNFQGIPRTNNRLQSFVDLVMWRDVSKSAFVFGVGTFAIISSSYTKDLNISFISVLSYLGLVYLAAIFLFRSLISRVEKDNADQDCVIGEEEAVWVIKLLLPSINEFLLKLRALFSGDPSTTMKLAMLLFILARCGSSITIWTTAKLGFIGVFTVPKVCSTYCSQITAHGTFWIKRVRETWASCSHKKAVGFAVFALVWNLSSVVVRIWAVFMVFVAFKHYQQSSMKEGWAQDEEINGGDSSCKEQKLGRRTTLLNNTGKLKKGC